MSRITQQLLRKRSEHNECMLTSLEEISLHQQEIIKIQNLDILCRHLKILYLQNNIIEKLENLNKLKELEYLNIALNNISKIENIEGCESLKKLDFTVNFIDAEDLESSAICLSKLPNLKQIYLVGNPCEDWKSCQDYIIAMVPQLQVYNGNNITPSQRIKAIQELPNLKMDLYLFAQMRRIEKRKKQIEKQQQKRRRQMNGQKEDDKQPYTKQIRRQMYYQIAKDKEKKEREKNPEKFAQKVISPMFTKQGQIRQCNEGKYPFRLRQYDHPDYVYFEIEVPKFLQTKQMQVNVNPKWVSVRIKGKLTQLRLSQQVIVSQSKTERSQVTGILTITMKKLNSHNFIKVQNKKQQKQSEKKKQQQQKKKKESQQRNRILKLCQQYENKKEQDDDVPPLQ